MLEPRDFHIVWVEATRAQEYENKAQNPDHYMMVLKQQQEPFMGRMVLSNAEYERTEEGPKGAPYRIRYRWHAGIVCKPGEVSNVVEQLKAERRAGYEDAIAIFDTLAKRRRDTVGHHTNYSADLVEAANILRTHRHA